MLGAVHQLIVEEFVAGGVGNSPHIVSIGRHGAQRGLEVLEREHKAATTELMSDAQDDERIDIRAVKNLLVRPGVDRATPGVIDMRGKHAAERPRGPTRSLGSLS